ncbi:hypothetical protein Syun_026081 [Stephania yunnanensis]|uniref:Uncharacterized protein n=1 Tax=Stephania yunnanensis TaxID=152371 RepID=A0AAP0ESV0_9MAGN
MCACKKGTIGSRYRIIIKTITGASGRWDDTIHEDLIHAAYNTHAGIRSRQASLNRNTKVEGPGTGASKHGGGSVSFVTTHERLAKLQQRHQELTQATPDQPVDDEAMYYDVAGECPKGRVYGIGSLGRKKRRFADSSASTSQLPEMVPRSEFDSVAEHLRQVVAFMQRKFGMTIDGACLS